MSNTKARTVLSALIAASAFGALGAKADESIGDQLAGAALEDPACIGGAVANAAVDEGLKRGRRLLGRLGIETAARSGNAPCAAPAAQPRPAAASAAPPPAAPAAPAQRRGGLLGGGRPAQRQRNCGALGAGCADGLQPLVACMNEVSFWGEMADAVERKRQSAEGLGATELADMSADIAAMRAAHAANASRVEPVDTARPNRHTDWLSPEEYSAAATAAARKLDAHREDCNRKHAKF
jgi:hypothetical protein